MSAYGEVDGVIGAWVEATGATLFTRCADKEARFFHFPGAPPNECFQLSIEPPSAGRIAVSARSIETNDGSQLERTWEGPIRDLDVMLASGVSTIGIWKRRPQASGG